MQSCTPSVDTPIVGNQVHLFHPLSKAQLRAADSTGMNWNINKYFLFSHIYSNTIWSFLFAILQKGCGNFLTFYVSVFQILDDSACSYALKESLFSLQLKHTISFIIHQLFTCENARDIKSRTSRFYPFRFFFGWGGGAGQYKEIHLCSLVFMINRATEYTSLYRRRFLCYSLRLSQLHFHKHSERGSR